MNKMTRLGGAALMALTVALAAAGLANADAVNVNPTGNASCGSGTCVAAVSGTGTATCNRETCVAVSGLGSSNAGTNSCATFVCGAVAVSGPLGSSHSNTYCTSLSQVCFAASADAGVLLKVCYGGLYDWACTELGLL